MLARQSRNESYNAIQANIDIPWKCEYVKYWVSSINFTANMYNITVNDYIEVNGQPIRFDNAYITNKTELLQIIKCQDIVFDVNVNNQLTMFSVNERKCYVV